MGGRHRRCYGGIITRIARHRSAHRAFCQSVNAKLTVPPDFQCDNFLGQAPKTRPLTAEGKSNAVHIRLREAISSMTIAG
jgi:hypothetical protein